MASAQAVFDWRGPFGLSERERHSGGTSTASSSQLLSSADLCATSAEAGAQVSTTVRLLSRSHEELADWALQAATELTELLNLPPGWNSYAAKPIERRTVQAAWDVLSRFMLATTPPPAIVPTNRGGVQFEWHTDRADLEISVYSPFQSEVFFEDLGSQERWEGTLPHVAARLERAIVGLSAR